MYVITASWDNPDETPIAAFDAKNDVEALTKVRNELNEMIVKATAYAFGGRPWMIALWNVTVDINCVYRFDTYIEP